MGFWKNLFNKKESSDQSETDLPPNYAEFTKKAIELIGKNSRGMDNEQLSQLLISNGIPDDEATEFVIFLPTTFCRKLLPEIDWPSNYVDYYSDEKKISRRYSDNKRYMVMQKETEKYWTSASGSEWVLNIAGRSAEFNAINQLLNDGGKLEDVQLAEVLVMRDPDKHH